MTNNPVKTNKNSALKKVILTALVVMLLLIATWHILLPLLGISIIALSAGIWNIAIATIVIICVSTLLFFLLTTVGTLILGVGVLLWTVVAIALFPLLFPIVLPAFLLMLVIGLLLRKKKVE